jgi:hypothetical protein
LGYHLIKEYKDQILFRSGCGAGGPCFYPLVDKRTGRLVTEFWRLIEADTDANWKNPHPYEFEFVVHYDHSRGSLIVYYINSGKTLRFPFDFEKYKLTSAVPEQQFLDMTLNDDVLTLTFRNDENEIDRVDLDLKRGRIQAIKNENKTLYVDPVTPGFFLTSPRADQEQTLLKLLLGID